MHGMKTMKPLFLLLLMLYSSSFVLATTIEKEAGSSCVIVKSTAQEFYASYAGIFRMSDGSSVSVSTPTTAQIDYVKSLMKFIPVTVTAQEDEMTMKVCDKDNLDILLLAVLGKFVTNPGEPSTAQSSSANAVPSIVVDTYTGKLAVHMPYDAVRGYFVEALLVISIIVITRLSFVRNVTYQVIYPSVAAQQQPSVDVKRN